MKHRLTVKIEKRFKKQLSKRFNPGNIISDYYYWINGIRSQCSLCVEYLFEGCKKCPFKKFEDRKNVRSPVFTTVGCMVWITRIVGKEFFDIVYMTTEMISWSKNENKKAIELLKKLREKAKKYIVWTENTK